MCLTSQTVDSTLDRQTFIESLYAYCEGKIQLRAVPPENESRDVKTTFCAIGDHRAIDDFIRKHANDNLYFTVATRNGGGRKEHIVNIPAVWVDIDFKDIPEAEAEKRLREFPLRPTYVVRSGGGLHVYWLFKEPLTKKEIAFTEYLLKQLAVYFDADMSVTDASHILRLPDTRNFKYRPPALVKIVEHGEMRYDPSDFEFLPELDTRSLGNGSISNPADWQDEALQGVEKGKRNSTATKLAGRYVCKGLADEEIFPILQFWNQKNSPPLTDRELLGVIHSIRKTHARNHPGGSLGEVPTSLTQETNSTNMNVDGAMIKKVAFRLSDAIALNKKKKKIGEQTGFHSLDSTICGLLKSHFWTIGGYTSHGKTAFMTQLIVNTIRFNPNIGITVFSTEMSAENILLRLMANRTAIPSLSIFRGRFDLKTQEQVDEALDYFHNKKIFIFDNVYSFDGINERCKAITAIFRLDVVFVDFLQNMQGEGSIYERMSVIPVQLQKMAKELNTCVVAMSQVSNEAVRADSKLIGYKGAGEIAAACDLGLWLERDQNDPTKLLCAIRKNRHGPTGKKELRFQDNFTRITEID